MHYDNKKTASALRYLVFGVIIFVLLYFSQTTHREDAFFADYRYECLSCEEIEAVVNKLPVTQPFHTIALFDIDETIIRRVSTNDGSSEWFAQSMEYLQTSKLLSFEEARNVVFPLYKNYLFANEIELVESSWPWLFSALRKNGIHSLVLTRRSAELGDFTSEWLERLGISLSKDYFGETRTVELHREPARYVNGALFCGLNSKEETLGHFLTERHKEQPYSKLLVVVYVDDGSRYIDEVAHGLKSFAQQYKIKVMFYGILYKAMSPQLSFFELNERHKLELDEAYEAFIEAEEQMLISNMSGQEIE